MALLDVTPTALSLARQHGLNLLEYLPRDERGAGALVQFPEPPEIPGVDRVLEHPMNFRLRHRPVATPVRKTELSGLPPNG